MRFEFQPISHVGEAAEWHPIIEAMTLFSGSCAPADLEWDEDELLCSLIEATDDAELKEDYRAEPTFGIREAKDRFISELIELIDERQAILGSHSPFERDASSPIILQRKALGDTSEAGLAYAWLVLFWAISSSKERVVISAQDKSDFIRTFAAVFEYICAMLLVARKSSAVYYFGDSRDVREFLRRLASLIALAGNGAIKTYSSLEAHQTGANDAGVDALAVDLFGGQIRGDSTTYLLGATIQKSDRRNKIVGINEITRFTKYFEKAPKLAYKGILAIPFEASEMEHLVCRDKDCLYISKQDILRILSSYPSEDFARLAYIFSPRRKMISKSREFQRRAVLVSSAGELRIAWA